MDCIFCKLAAGEIPTQVVYEDDEIFVFQDGNPQADVHYLAIPKSHIASMNEIEQLEPQLVGRIFQVISKIAKRDGFSEDGYRVVNNCGKDGGQTVGHLHFHILAGRPFGWPPG